MGSDRRARGAAAAVESGSSALAPSRRPASATWRRAVEVLRDEGVGSLWFKILGETVYRRVWVVERRLSAPPVTPPPASDLDLGELAPGEAEQLVELGRPTDPDEVRERLRAGQRCFVARRAGRLEHAIWTAPRSAPIDYLEWEVPLATDELYAFEAFTSPSSRGHRVSIAVADAMAAILAAEGYRRLLGVVMPENRAGVVSSWLWGYRPIGVMRSLRLGSWRRHSGSFAPSPRLGRRLERKVWPDAPRERSGGAVAPPSAGATGGTD